MVEKSQGAAAEGENAAPAAVPGGAPRRPGHRGMDPRETVAELTAKAHEISQTAGSKVAAAMKEVIGAAAGLTGFAVESARDLIQYMVRRGQMTQMEGDKLLREVEAAHGTRKPAPRADERPRSAPAAAIVQAATTGSAPKTEKPARKAAPVSEEAPKPAKKSKAATGEKPATRKSTDKTATPNAAEKTAAPKAAEKTAAPKAAAKKSEEKGSAKKPSVKGSASRSEATSRPRAASKSAPNKKKQ